MAVEASVSKLSPEDRARIMTQSVAHFRNLSGADLLKRTDRFLEFIQSRSEFGLWPYSRVLEGGLGPLANLSSGQAGKREGINFVSQDYLGLSRHQSVVDAGIEAMRAFGSHSGSSAILSGNTPSSLELERHLADFLGMEHVALYPSGWAAGYGAIIAFVRPRDFIIIDHQCHPSLHQGAAAATPQINHFIHNDAEDLRARLKGIRAKDSRNGILVITEGLFAVDSEMPDLAAMQSACRESGATLLVNVAHDLGALGPGGGGVLAAQGMLGKVDLVVGSFAKTFATNGGFLACHSAAAKQFAKHFGNPHAFSTALSPVQTAVASQAISIARSPEGDALRARLAACVEALRAAFAADGVSCPGVPSPIVLVPFHNDRLARLTSRRITDGGVFADLVEYPVVPVDEACLRLQVMATHGTQQAGEAARVIREARHQAEDDLKLWRSPGA